ncbi:MAG: DNA gyrase/topoisomerase IV subunit A [Bacteroidetes bacterium]|nr:MAG: DNA gyrase/topoisomerase IV subunit A [Bacteroidota bacterium]
MKDEEEELNEENTEQNPENQDETEKELQGVIPISGMYENWFLDYASYVILERAVPAIEDGLKPVQRRILHAMKEMDDGRFNKVANIIGQTMQYHPHGDASIGDALVNIGQKDLLVETQGNWGDFRTGDSAAAPRYIEARLSKFALEVTFNHKTTEWQLSYDGRKKEPVTLPIKFPLLLAQGVEGIAVGLSTKILPHNFCELLQASIDQLKGKKVELYPDFPTGGMVDVSAYNNGMRGGRVRVRAKIEEFDKKTLLVKDIPYGVTTGSLIDSIVKANDQGKIKIKKVIDNTAKDVEVAIHLAPGVSPDITMDALYAFTDCEVSISPNACVIVDDKPLFLPVEEMLTYSTEQTMDLLKQELEIKLSELESSWHYSSLEKIFIENRIYRDIEECETWEAVLETIDKGLDPFKKFLRREVIQDDIIRLTEIKIKRISKFDGFKADEYIKGLEEQIEETKNYLANMVEFTINYFSELLKKYGKGKERKTEIRTFDTIQATMVAVANQKLYVNRAEGFVGYALKKDEYVSECSDIDDIIVFRENGTFTVSKVQEKAFVGKDIIHVAVFKKGDDRMVYNLIYQDGAGGMYYVKRFAVTSVTRDKEYDVTKGTKGSKLLYFTANPNSEAEVITVTLSPNSKARKKVYDFDFAEIAIKGRGAQGNIFSRYRVKGIKFKEKGASTLGGRDIWYDETIGRLNTEERGAYLGNFDGDDTILVIYKDGSYELTNFEITNHYEYDKIELIRKFNPKRPLSVVHFDKKSKNHYVKRFLIETTTQGKTFTFISENPGAKMEYVSLHPEPEVIVHRKDGKGTKTEEQIRLDEFIDVKGWKALGNKLGSLEIVKIVGVKKEEPVEVVEEKKPVLPDTDDSPEDNGGEVEPVKLDVPVGPKPEFPKDVVQGNLFEI